MIKQKQLKGKKSKIKKIFKIIGKILLGILITVICFILVLAIINKIFLSIESKNIQVIGQRVEVYDNEFMNVYVTGAGEHTIVLLSGYGTSVPTIDFKKLADKIGENYRVAIVEYFGYGFSDETSNPRTNSNIIYETRTALSKVGLKPPYILMPHSVSGIYSMYYANKYPSEIEAIVGLDIAFASITNYLSEKDMQTPYYYLYPLISKLGIARFVINVFPVLSGFNESLTDGNKEYTDTIKYIISKGIFNSTVMNEGEMCYTNEIAIKDIKYPNNLPVLTILSQDTIDQATPNTTYWPIPKNWLELHEELITNSKIQPIEVLSGSHFIHLNNADKISELVKTFVDKNLNYTSER